MAPPSDMGLSCPGRWVTLALRGRTEPRVRMPGIELWTDGVRTLGLSSPARVPEVDSG